MLKLTAKYLDACCIVLGSFRGWNELTIAYAPLQLPCLSMGVMPGWYYIAVESYLLSALTGAKALE